MNGYESAAKVKQAARMRIESHAEIIQKILLDV